MNYNQNLSNNLNYKLVKSASRQSSLSTSSSMQDKPPNMSDSHYRDILYVKHGGQFPQPNEPGIFHCQGCNFGCYYCSILPYHREQKRIAKGKFEDSLYKHFQQHPAITNDDLNTNWTNYAMDGSTWMHIFSYLGIRWRIRIGRLVSKAWENVMPHVEIAGATSWDEMRQNYVELIWIAHYCKNIIALRYEGERRQFYDELFEKPNMQTNVKNLNFCSISKMPNVKYPKLKSLTISYNPYSLSFLGDSKIDELSINCIDHSDLVSECPNFSDLKRLKVSAKHIDFQQLLNAWSSTLEVIEVDYPSEQSLQTLINTKLPHLKKIYLFTAEPIENFSNKTEVQEFINKYVCWKLIPKFDLDLNFSNISISNNY